MDDDDFLAAVEADNASMTVTEEPKAETPPEPKSPEPEAPAELLLDTLAPTTPETKKSDDAAAEGRLIALLDTRDKLRSAEAELARFREREAQPVQMPDAYEDPEGFADARDAVNQQALYKQKLFFSERLAAVEHGAETVRTAKDWGVTRCDTDPYFNAKVAASEDPIGFVVAEYKREEIASKVTPDDFTQFQAWKAAQSQMQQTPNGVPPNPTSAIPTRSLASAPSAGSILTEPVQSDEEAFNEVLPRR